MKAFRNLLSVAALLALLAVGVSLPSSAQPVPPFLGPVKNLLIGGDFGTNPWQRGTSSVGGNIANTATYTADRWFAFGGASSSINISQSSTAPAGFANSLQFQRTAANSNTAQVCIAQIVESNKVIPLQGLPITFSFSAEAAANFSGTALVANLITSTATNQTAANLVTAAWTGQATLATQSIPFTQAANGAAFTRYFPGQTGGPFTSLTAVVPTNVQSLAAEICWVPVGTAGTTDAVLLAGIQLEQNGGATSFERLEPGQVLSLAQRYTVVYTDSAAALVFPATCTATSTTAVLCAFPLPVAMRAAPTPVWSNTTSFGMTCGSTANAAASAWAVVASSATTISFGATATTGTTTAGFGCVMTGKNTAVTLTISAEL